jgi:hypothetical protein
VFDWCYDYLGATEKADLIAKIDNLRHEHKNNRETGIRHQFRKDHDPNRY